MDIRQRFSRCSAAFNGLRALAFFFFFLAATSESVNHTSGRAEWRRLALKFPRAAIDHVGDSFSKGARFIKEGLRDNGKRRILSGPWFDVVEN